MALDTPKPKADPEDEPNPGVGIGDEVFFNHPKGPLSGKVICHGKNGATLHDSAGTPHKIRWKHIIGHKKRALQSYEVSETGEDGHILVDAAGNRRFMRIENESREDPLVAKAAAPGGPVAGRAGLTKKQITDKTGRRQTKWVRTQKDQPKERRQAKPDEPVSTHKKGDTVEFKAGEFHGEGTVVGRPGRDGAHVKDSTGRVHPISWKEMKAAGKPTYEKREAGESDKQYAKRAIDTREEPKHLPEKHDRYFHTEGAKTVGMNKLHSTKSAEENRQGGSNGGKRMEAAYHGALSKRAPVTVMPHAKKEGHYDIVDGNGTHTTATQHGWKSLPVNVVDRATGAQMQAEDKAKQLAEKVVDPKKFAQLPVRVAQPTTNREELFEKGREGLEQLRDLLNRGKGAISQLGYRTMATSPGKVDAEDWDKPGGMLFIAPLKELEGRATEKVNADYGGDWSKLLDVVRCTVAVDTLHDMSNAINALKSKGLTFAQQPKNRFIKPTLEGYMDVNGIVTLPNGMQAEVQFNVKDMMKAKNEGHKFYEITRGIEAKYQNAGLNDPAEWTAPDREEYKEAYQKQTDIYRKGWLDHVGRYGESGKGAP